MSLSALVSARRCEHLRCEVAPIMERLCYRPELISTNLQAARAQWQPALPMWSMERVREVLCEHSILNKA